MSYRDISCLDIYFHFFFYYIILCTSTWPPAAPFTRDPLSDAARFLPWETILTSTVYWCIASKLKVPLTFYGMNNTFLCVDSSLFNQSNSGGITTTKSLPDIGGTTIQDVGCLAAMGLAMEPGVHTMSDKLILQISCNIFLDFKWILMMRWGQNVSHYTTAKPSVHVWNHDLIWWQDKIDTQKTFPQDYDYEP